MPQTSEAIINAWDNFNAAIRAETRLSERNYTVILIPQNMMEDCRVSLDGIEVMDREARPPAEAVRLAMNARK